MLEKYTQKTIIDDPEDLHFKNWSKIKYKNKNLSRFKKTYAGIDNGKIAIYTKNKIISFAEDLISLPNKLIPRCFSGQKKIQQTEEETKLHDCISSLSHSSNQSEKNVESLRKEAAESIKEYVKECQIKKGLRDPDPEIEKLYHLEQECKLTFLESFSEMVNGKKYCLQSIILSLEL